MRVARTWNRALGLSSHDRSHSGCAGFFEIDAHTYSSFDNLGESDEATDSPATFALCSGAASRFLAPDEQAHGAF